MLVNKFRFINVLIYLIYLLSSAVEVKAQAYRDDSSADLDQIKTLIGLEKSVFNEFVENKKYLCNQVTEFTYRSPKLISANRDITVYFEATWKRRPQPASDGVECGGIGGTTKATMLIEREHPTYAMSINAQTSKKAFVRTILVLGAKRASGIAQ
ncbi:MAG: hypothetical protein N5P05_000439 [Chroococcopsis gigantea SAG 12.99]|jgi:hypothetical protein|nr:hypothetical protein [Chroococcopsis gigantea SAG 12.99]